MARDDSREAQEKSAERFQIFVLTPAMIAFFLALCTAVLSLFLNPAARRRVERLSKETVEIKKLLDSSEMWNLRAQAKLNEQTATAKTIAQIMTEHMQRRGLKVRTMPSTTVKVVGNIEERRQEVALEPAPLQNILMFVGDVKDAKPTIQVELVKLNRERRTGSEKDSWNATLKFIDYMPKATPAPAAKQGS